MSGITEVSGNVGEQRQFVKYYQCPWSDLNVVAMHNADIPPDGKKTI
jgi:hypothetical protein